MEKLNKMEERAKEACKGFIEDKCGCFVVLWSKNNHGSRSAAVWYSGEKCSYAGGCGYDKLSQALADFLRFLVPEKYKEIWATAGTGYSKVKDQLKEFGWNLEETNNVKYCTSFVVFKDGLKG